jgi:DNA-binding GntR family transcriptional regulator
LCEALSHSHRFQAAPVKRRHEHEGYFTMGHSRVIGIGAKNAKKAAEQSPSRSKAVTAAAPQVSAILEILRERIATQAIAPGSKLLEQNLAREFHISRARVREVLSALERRGLVRRELNKGAVVAKLELTEVFEIYDVREALEGLCHRLATNNASPETWDDLVELFGAPMEKLVAAGDIDTYDKALAQMRRRVIEAARNPVLAGMLDSVYEKTRTIMRRVLILPGRASKGLSEHQAVLVAMRGGDAAEAERLKRANIRSAINDLKRYQHYVL